MQETKITVQNDDRSTIIAAFFLGIAASLFMIIYWIAFKNILIFSFLSLTTLAIFLTIAVLLARPPKTNKKVVFSKINGPIRPLNPEKVNMDAPKAKPLKNAKKRGRPKKS